MEAGTSGLGESLATISSTSGFFFSRADSSTLRGRVTLAGDKALHLRDELGIGKASQGSEDIVLHACL